MKNLSKVVLTILSTLVASSVLAQCPTGGCGGNRGGYTGGGNTNYDSGRGHRNYSYSSPSCGYNGHSQTLNQAASNQGYQTQPQRAPNQGYQTPYQGAPTQGYQNQYQGVPNQGYPNQYQSAPNQAYPQGSYSVPVQQGNYGQPQWGSNPASQPVRAPQGNFNQGNFNQGGFDQGEINQGGINQGHYEGIPQGFNPNGPQTPGSVQGFYHGDHPDFHNDISFGHDEFPVHGHYGEFYQ